jgi:hypothetical protein
MVRPLSGLRRAYPFLGVQMLPLDAGSPDAFLFRMLAMIFSF